MNQNLKRLVASINKTNRIRVWSMIITFFGDAIVPRAGAVSARTCQEVMERLGIGDGAVRTAFSRLTQDGWFIRERQGRASFYSLSPQGLEPFAEASRQIYAPRVVSNNPSDDWLIALDNQSSRAPVLIESPTKSDIEKLSAEDCLLVSGTLQNVPQWLKTQYAPPEAAERYQQLIHALTPLVGQTLSDIDCLAARCILIHEWRRLLLRYHHVPPQLRPADWPEDECQALVMQLYAQFLAPSEAWLDEFAIGPDGHLPAANQTVKTRFQ